MKKTLLAVFLLASTLVHSQWQRRSNLNYSTPQLRNERFNSGIRTTANYGGGNPNFFYFIGIGTSYRNTALPVPPNGSNRLRFFSVNSGGVNVFNNRGYQFTDNIGKYFHSFGNSISEADNGVGTGGYVAVGAVTNNNLSGANTIAGGSDILFTRLNGAGIALNASNIDVNNGGDDTAWCIRKSSITDEGKSTWILCGQSTKGTRTDCVVARVLSTGEIGWCYTYNFDPDGPPFNTARCIAKQLCEGPNGNIYVVGTLKNNGMANTDGLAFALGPGGGLLWANNYDDASDDEFQAVRLAANGNLIIGGFTNAGVAAPVTHNMLLVQLAPAAGGIVFQKILQALANNGDAKFTSKCYDIVQGPGGNFFLAGLIIRNGVNAEMLYRANQAGVGQSWNNYNTMLYDVGFGVDTVSADLHPGGVIYFSSMKNFENPGFSDSHIMKTDFQGRTCNFCETKNPLTKNANLERTMRNGPRRDVYAKHNLAWERFDYDDNLICDSACGQLFAKSLGKQSQSLKYPTTNSNSLIISPNPTVNTLHVQFNSLPAGDYQVTLTNMDGKLVLQRNSVYNSGSSATDIDLSSFAAGIYVLTIKRGEFMIQQKVIKQ